MKTITTEDFNELRDSYDSKKACKPNEHRFLREVYLGGTGDYICEKCGFTVNECDIKDYIGKP